MIYKVEILPIAQKDISDNAKWYNAQLKGLGLRFTKAIRNEIKFIQKNPRAIVNRYRNTHTCTVDNFPYMIHYIIEEEQKKIVIVGVFKYQQSPDKWEER